MALCWAPKVRASVSDNHVLRRKQQYRWIVVVLILVCLLLAACGQSQPAADSEEAQAATVEHLDGAEPTRVTLTEDAVQRLAIQTVAVRDTTVEVARVPAGVRPGFLGAVAAGSQESDGEKKHAGANREHRHLAPAR